MAQANTGNVKGRVEQPTGDAGDPKDPLTVYNRLAETFLLGAIRTIQARLAFKCSQVLIIGIHTTHSDLGGVPEKLAALISQNRHGYSEYDSYVYVTEASFLVYVTTLLDTFLTDTALFLFLSNPARLAEQGQQVMLRDVLAKRSRSELINGLAKDRVRRLAQESFEKRLNVLERKFGLKLGLDAKTLEQLRHYKSVRNAFVHDQGVYEVDLDEAGTLRATRKACPIHPRLVESEEFQSAFKTYERTAAALYVAVTRDALKREDDPEVKKRVATFLTLTRAAAPEGGGAQEAPWSPER
jgi:hypothetical protein